jgi:hypothetical protein
LKMFLTERVRRGKIRAAIPTKRREEYEIEL